MRGGGQAFPQNRGASRVPQSTGPDGVTQLLSASSGVGAALDVYRDAVILRLSGLRRPAGLSTLGESSRSGGQFDQRRRRDTPLSAVGESGRTGAPNPLRVLRQSAAPGRNHAAL